MATRKKSPRTKPKPGLISPSRKQSDWEHERTGQVLRQTEKPRALTAASTSTTDATIVSVPDGYKATLLQLNYYITSASNRILQIRCDGTTVYNAFIADTTDVLGQQVFLYEEGPVAVKTISVTYAGGGGVSSADIGIRYALEPQTDGYFTS
jgi:hypothetical protein